MRWIFSKEFSVNTSTNDDDNAERALTHLGEWFEHTWVRSTNWICRRSWRIIFSSLQVINMHDKVLKAEQFFIDSRTISISHRVPLDSSLRCAVVPWSWVITIFAIFGWNVNFSRANLTVEWLTFSELRRRPRLCASTEKDNSVRFHTDLS